MYADKSIEILQNKITFGNHGNNKNCIKIVFDANKEGSNKDVDFWKII